ncbi:MAG: ribonuclease III [Clostridia bacterium]|nr:ribonuclease III [Clostridia bacterium]
MTNTDTRTDLFSPKLDINEASQLPALTLAYVGDTICDLFVRTRLVLSQNGDVGSMHRQSSALVNAKSQAVLARDLMDELDGLEKDVFMRGRNAKSNTVPKNMSIADYHHATALEALIGFLYLTGQLTRAEEILQRLEPAEKDEEAGG